jgi:plastocyanin
MRTLKLLILGLAVFSLNAANPVFAGTINGTVKSDGQPPKLKPIKMDADPICLSHHTAEVLPQTLVLGEGGTMGNVFVQVKNAPADTSAPTGEVVITQEGCEYHPHVVGVRAGQTVKLLNPDGTLHNVHAMPKVNKEFNLAMPKFRTETTVTFTDPEFMFSIKCDKRRW